MTTNVIVADRVEEEAYDLGYDRFEGLAGEETEDFTLSPFRDGAEYANQVLPRLRALAGFTDPSGVGTYTSDTDIVIVDEADLDDDPIAGESWTASEYHSVLVDCWCDGARDAANGRERGDSL